MTNPDGNRIDATNLERSTIIAGDNYGITVADHERLLASQMTTLETKHSEIIAQMREAQFAREEASAAKLELLQHKLETTTAQLTETRRRADNPEKSLAEMQARIAELETLLEHSTVEIGENRLKSAHDAMAKGDFSEADTIFAEVQQHEQRAVERYAEAAFGRGLIAEQEIRWHDALTHYGIAAGAVRKTAFIAAARRLNWFLGRYKRAVSYGEDLIEVERSENGEFSFGYAYALNEHALTLQSWKEHAEVVRLCNLALQNLVEDSQQADLLRISIIQNTASSLRDLEEYDAAENAFFDVIALYSKLRLLETPQYSMVLNDMGLLYSNSLRFEDAETAMLDALKISKSCLGPKHPDYAKHLSNYAELLEKMQRFAKSERLQRRAIEIGIKAVGEIHPDIAARKNNLARVLSARGKINEARKEFAEMHEIDLATNGWKHSDTKGGANLFAYFLKAHFPDDPALADLQAIFGPDIGK